MATKKPRNTALAPVVVKDILKFTETAMRTYGVEVNEDRSVPDYRDGLKPVGRRILWALHLLPADRLLKTARLVGDVIGKFHPHGESSIFGAIVTEVNAPVAGIHGEGNWGTLVDGAAAMRYTNVRMSQYGRNFFGRNYTPIATYVPTFDRSDKEPLYLPALLPNLLFNGEFGIGVGMTTSIPAFTPASVLKMMVRMLDSEELTTADFVKGLVFHFQYGGVVTKTQANRKAIASFFEGPKGSVQWESPLEIDEVAKTITISRFAPEVKPLILLEKVRAFPEVRTAIGGKGLSYVISARKDLNLNEFKKLIEKVQRLTTSKISYEVYVTERKLVKVDQGDGTTKLERRTLFHTLSIPELMNKWLQYRIRLEVASLKYQMVQADKDIAYQKLLIFASDNLDVIFKALRQSDAAAYMVKMLKLTLEQANQILDLKVRMLSRLDQDKLKARLRAAEAHRKDLKLKLSDPVKEVRAFLVDCAQRFEYASVGVGTDQFALKRSTAVKPDNSESEETV